MTNLNAVLQVYFVDADIDDVLNSAIWIKSSNFPVLSISEGMNEQTFRRLFINHNSMYGTDVVSNIYQLANKWRYVEGVKKPGLFNILAHATDKILRWVNDEPVCDYNSYLRWNDISSIVGEDLLTTSYLAFRSVRENLKVSSFAWKPCITSYNPELNHILEKGLGELHFHMLGSSLGFDVTWMSLMNSESISGKLKKKIDGLNKYLYEWIEKARASRIFLYKRLKYKDIDLKKDELYRLLKDDAQSLPYHVTYLRSEITNEKINAYRFGRDSLDYAISGAMSERDRKRYYNVPLIGERKLLYNHLKEIFSGNEEYSDCVLPLYIYLLVKNKFRKYIVQNDSTKGFSYFQEIQSRKSKYIDEKYKKLFQFMAVQTTIGNQPIQKLEMRITPENNSSDLKKDLREYNVAVNDELLRLKEPNIVHAKKTKIGYVIHFLKRSEKKCDAKLDRGDSCRHSVYRKDLEKQANAIAQLIRDNSMYIKGGFRPYFCNNEKFIEKIKKRPYVYPIIGIDAASSEFGCRPEVFAPVFRRLRAVSRRNNLDSFYEKNDMQLGRTFHVGEDFYDIVDGLRAIDECIYFLNFESGDRIGHAVALGINAYNYYKTRNFNIVLPMQILLDNAVWLLKKMEEYSINDLYGTKYKLKEIFETYFRMIYTNIDASIEDYYASWLLRGDEPSRTKDSLKSEWKLCAENNFKPIFKQIRLNEKALDLYERYHYCKEVKEKGEEIVEYQLDDGDVLIINEVQKKMRQKIAREKIAIETNPTSNLRITDIDRYSKHPITAFYNRGLKPNYDPDQITVSINTDDQGVFATSLEKEYTLISCALEKKRNDDGTPTYSPKDIYKWLDDVRESSLVSSFLDDEMS